MTECLSGVIAEVLPLSTDMLYLYTASGTIGKQRLVMEARVNNMQKRLC